MLWLATLTNYKYSYLILSAGYFYPSCWFSFNNPETMKAAALTNILLQIFTTNFVSPTCFSSDVLSKTQRGYLRFPDF